MVGDFDKAILRLLENIHLSYERWNMNTEYPNSIPRIDITTKTGRKFIKIIRDNSVWGFVAKSDGTHKGVPMKMGDVLKAASYNAAAKHTRGNIFDGKQDYFGWTGPNYR